MTMMPRRLADLTGIDLLFEVVEPLEDQLGKIRKQPYNQIPI
jgi:hypothetical protein